MKNKVLSKVITGGLWLLIWQLLAMAAGKELILPGPLPVLKALAGLVQTPDFWKNTLSSVLRILAGYGIGVVLGTLLAVLSCASDALRSFFAPALRIVRATPVASFIILAMLWMTKSNVPVLMACLMVIPIVWGNIVEAYGTADEKLLEMAKAYRLGAWKRFRFIYVPWCLPSFRAACTTSIGLAWKSGIAAEVLSLPKYAIGANLYYSKIYLETPELFAWTITVILLSFAVEKIVVRMINGPETAGNGGRE